MKISLIIAGLFFIIFFCIIPLGRDIKEYEVQKNGELITATITYIPNCIGSKIKYFMKFTYAGQEFDKKVGCSFSDTHKIGETIKLKHTDGTDIFLFENENKETEFISTALLAILGITFIVIGARKK
jgi:hypothetical protein